MPQVECAAAPAAPANDQAVTPLAVSIFADGPSLREQMCEDVLAAGLALRECSALAGFDSGDPRALGEVVLLDCPTASAAALAALARLDMRARRAGAHLIVSTGAAALDAVFACCDQSRPQILVDPSRAERVIAIGRALARIPRLRLHQLSQADRSALLQLTEQLGEFARRIETGASPPSIIGEDRGLRLESPATAFAAFPAAFAGDRRSRAERPSLPDPRLVRRIIRQRQMRARYFDGALFADPAWDILLDLTAARAEQARVSVTSLCIASGVPPTTALRWIGQMCEAGLLERVADDEDRRRAFIALSDEAAEAMARYFAGLGPMGVPQG